MVKKQFLQLLLLLLLLPFTVLGQITPARIYQGASPLPNPLDQNGDGWISATNAGFTSGESVMEIPFVAIPQVSGEPSADPRLGGNCGSTDIVDNPGTNADASYVYYTTYGGQQVMIYRMRMAANATGAFGFSVLVDTDGKIGNTGTSADPNFIGPQGGNKPGNPGFEFEIAYVTGGGSNGVNVYNIDGTLNGTLVTSYGLGTNAQRSYARYTSAGCTGQPVFYDFFIPISSMGLTSSSTIRLAAATCINPGSVFGGASDIAGVNEASFPVPDDALIALIRLQNPTPIDNLDETGCFINGTSATPVITGNRIFDSQTSVSGTSSEADGAVVRIYRNGIELMASATVNGGTWSFTAAQGTFRPYDRISITVKDPCKYVSAAADLTVIDDLDSDSDGIPDLDEGNGKDPGADDDGDRIPNFKDTSYAGFVDLNADGIHDYFDADRDGVPNHLDLDSDNDAIPDAIEAGGVALDLNADGRLDDIADSNANGLADVVDASSGGTPLRKPDTDLDGLMNAYDLDADGDGLADLIEAGGADSNGDAKVDGFLDANLNGLHDMLELAPLPMQNADADMYLNYLDVDSDNDGITDNREAQSSAAYLAPSGRDSNTNGLDDAYDAAAGGLAVVPVNTDGDALPDFRDPDSDGDGVLDLTEGNDLDRNGVADRALNNADADGDGLDNAFDNAVPGAGNASGSVAVRQDTDGDGQPDWRDTDDDGDNLITNLEDTNNNGNFADDFGAGGGLIPNYLYKADYDGDGIADRNDLDSDNDGRRNSEEDGGTGFNPTGFYNGSTVMNYLNRSLPAGFIDVNADGINDLFDRDLDGIPDFHDLDSDNDGITDLREAGGTDTDNNGRVDGFQDTNGDGLHDPLLSAPLMPLYSDADGLANAYDIDADADGIADIFEAQASANFIAPAYRDVNRNGLDDAYDVAAGGVAIVPVDTDADGRPDYLDLDADGDGILDRIEGFDANGDGVADLTPSGQDTDKDGLDNTYDAVVGPALVNAAGGRASRQDTDGDGKRDWQDADDDADGILSAQEGFDFAQGGRPRPDYLYKGDYDGDGVADRADVDADNDGIADSRESGNTGYDPTADQDNDGIMNYMDAGELLIAFVDHNADGINDRYDADLDGIPDFQDLDSDNDGVTDLMEAGGSDPDGDGRLAGPFATNGLAVSLNGIPLTVPDSDGDGVLNSYDLDSDNDLMADLIENRGSDLNKDGRVDNFQDLNRNGIADVYDVSVGGAVLVVLNTDGTDLPNYLDADSDNDGIPDLQEAGGADADNNGITDVFADANRNGLADYVDPALSNLPLTMADTDGDGRLNAYDVDSDADGILDALERMSKSGAYPVGGADSDGDGQPDYVDADADNDGITDLVEGNDANRDGQADRLPTGVDTDGDGWDNAFDGTNGGVAPVLQNTDGDSGPAVPDYRDNDDDNDGIKTIDEPLDINPVNSRPDYLENVVGSCGAGFISSQKTGNADRVASYSTGMDATGNALGQGDGNRAGFMQTGSWMVLDLTDTIQQGATILLRLANWNGSSVIQVSSSLIGTTGSFTNPVYLTASAKDPLFTTESYTVTQLSGIRYLYILRVDNKVAYLDAVSYNFTACASDKDFDGVVDTKDLDDDNDGISDVTECGGDNPSADADGDGLPNYKDPDFNGSSPVMVLAAWVDVNNDGINDIYDLDLDGVPNHFDLDSDNDGITDAVEGNRGVLPANMLPQGRYSASFVILNDNNRNGWANPFDPNSGGTLMARPDSDLDGRVDHWDINSDNDLNFDWIEGFDDNRNGDALDDLLARAAAWEQANGSPGIFSTADADGDRRPNWMEDDDADGLPNFLDPSAVAFYRDSNKNGLADLYDADLFGKIATVPDVNGNGILEYIDNSTVVLLPIELLHFGAAVQQEGILLNWQTASETNNEYFEIQRSADGINFNALNRMKGAGNSKQTLQYAYLDKQPRPGQYYYRLKQVDTDGAYTYSPVAAVAWLGTMAKGLNIYPNPVTDRSLHFSVGSTADATVAYKIINIQGRTVGTGEIKLNTGEAQLDVPLPLHLQQGIYMIEIQMQGQVLMGKFIIAN